MRRQEPLVRLEGLQVQARRGRREKPCLALFGGKDAELGDSPAASNIDCKFNAVCPQPVRLAPSCPLHRAISGKFRGSGRGNDKPLRLYTCKLFFSPPGSREGGEGLSKLSHIIRGTG